MYKNIDLVNIPNTLKRLGDPIEVGAANSNLRDTDDYLNYAVRVKLNTYADSYVGKIFHKEASDYVGQTKLDNFDAFYAASFVGMDILYSDAFSVDPAWSDPDSISSYSATDNSITLTNSTTDSYKSYKKDLGYGAILSESKNCIFRTQIVLPSGDANFIGAVAFCAGITDSSEQAQSNSIGATFVFDSTWKVRMINEGTIDTSSINTISGLVANKIYTIDIILIKDTKQLMIVVYDSAGLVGAVSSSNNYWSGISTDGVGFWCSSNSSTANTITILNAEVWVDTAIVKVSKNNGITWEAVTSNPVALENFVDECAVAVDSNYNVHLVWTEYLSTYYGVNYAIFNSSTGVWGSTVEVNTSGLPDKINPNIVVDELGAAHICWISDSGSGNDLYYVKIGGGLIIDELIIVI